jgi:phosphomannomutase
VRTIYLFDIDGTLTAPLTPIGEEFASVFLEWVRRYKAEVYLVTGSNITKTKKQLFGAFRDICAGIFCCSGNDYRVGNKVAYRRKFKPSPELLEDLNLYLSNSPYPVKTGKHIERRPGMVNYSIVGRNATPLQRAQYAAWDAKHFEREDIVDYVKTSHPELDAAIGGAVSVDIYPQGRDKSQVVDYLRGSCEEEMKFVFVGDKIIPGGNDYPLAMKLEEDENSHWRQVNSPAETQALIQHSALFIGEGGI